MADIIPQPSLSKSLSKLEVLDNNLDDLWARYLDLLDQYQNLRQALADDLSDGHFNLAKANFSNPNRIWYGQDYYDERMQASTRLSTTQDGLFQIEHVSTTEERPTEAGKESEDSEEEAVEKDEANTDDGKRGNATKHENGKDPLNWFGILVPPTLRASQAAFKDAVTRVPELAALNEEMKRVEIEIRRTRKKLKKVG